MSNSAKKNVTLSHRLFQGFFFFSDFMDGNWYFKPVSYIIYIKSLLWKQKLKNKFFFKKKRGIKCKQIRIKSSA